MQTHTGKRAEVAVSAGNVALAGVETGMVFI